MKKVELEELSEGGFNYEEAAAWIRTRPVSVQRLMQVFPPGCLVRANRPLQIPAPGHIGVVYSYREDGLLGVLHYDPETEMPGDLMALCDPGWLEVHEYGNVTPEMMNRILGN